MDSDAAWNMYVFRDGRIPVCGNSLLDDLAAALLHTHSSAERDARNSLLDALLRAGEMECALQDAASPQAALLARIADQLAAKLLGAPAAALPQLLGLLAQVRPPEQVRVSPPEGFAYYALHPLDFAHMTQSLAFPSGAGAVIGVRSIGTTLSAVVQAALGQRGVRAERTTVRPIGHPYDRRTEFTPEQLEWIARHRSRSAEFVVVDEGPGMSGSSFLSVGDALLSAGVARAHIVFLCSRQPDVRHLRARNAAARWPAFRALYSHPTCHVPAEAKVYIGGGDWRRYLFPEESHWPASWIHMERLKFLSPDRQQWFKFEGFGRFGAEVHQRACLLGEAGFAPHPLGFEEGFVCSPMIAGEVLSAHSVCPKILEHMAQYCAFRGFELSSRRNAPSQLPAMLRFNLQEEFGIDLEMDTEPLSAAEAVICDSRMLPHEWIRTLNGRVLKLDNASHGDDHFFPGPTDIAWDLAGAIVEWDLGRDAARYLLDCYRRASGDDPSQRLPIFLLAYSVFRMAYCKMAAAAVRGSGEEKRLQRAYQQYRTAVAAHLPKALAA
jgi:hypothetical protein